MAVTVLETPANIDEAKYGKLLARHRPRAIRTLLGLDRCADLHERLCAKPTPTAEGEELISLLEQLIGQYERPLSAELETRFTPLDALRYIMEQAGLRQADLVPIFGSSGAVSEVLSGKRAISKAQARRMADHFRVDAGLFV